MTLDSFLRIWLHWIVLRLGTVYIGKILINCYISFSPIGRFFLFTFFHVDKEIYLLCMEYDKPPSHKLRQTPTKE